MAPKLMSEDGVRRYLEKADAPDNRMGILAIVSPPSLRFGSITWIEIQREGTEWVQHPSTEQVKHKSTERVQHQSTKWVQKKSAERVQHKFTHLTFQDGFICNLHFFLGLEDDLYLRRPVIWAECSFLGQYGEYGVQIRHSRSGGFQGETVNRKKDYTLTHLQEGAVKVWATHLKPISYLPLFFSDKLCLASSITFTTPKSNPPSVPARWGKICPIQLTGNAGHKRKRVPWPKESRVQSRRPSYTLHNEKELVEEMEGRWVGFREDVTGRGQVGEAEGR